MDASPSWENRTETTAMGRWEARGSGAGLMGRRAS